MKDRSQRKKNTSVRPNWFKNEPLAPRTTFHIGGKADYFVTAASSDDIEEIVTRANEKKHPLLVLSGGSNMLINDRGYRGVVVQMASRGIRLLEETPRYVSINVSAGESWDALVAHSVTNGWWGLENLSHIPGRVGAAAIQNIGAYGSEISTAIESIEVFDRRTGLHRDLSHSECGFSYRRSLFNSEERRRYIILCLRLRLQKDGQPQLGYRDVNAYFLERHILNPTQRQIRQAIIDIRNSKFPFPTSAVGGNAGSFFKNLAVEPPEFDQTIRRLHDLSRPEYATRLEKLREAKGEAIRFIPTALLIDALGLKNLCVGGAYINPTQPLVILNSGSASSSDVMNLFQMVRQKIYQQFGLTVLNEPELVGFSPEEIKSYFDL